MACIFVLSSEHKLQIMIMDTLNPHYISSQIFLVKDCTTLDSHSVKNCVKWIFGGSKSGGVGFGFRVFRVKWIYPNFRRPFLAVLRPL